MIPITADDSADQANDLELTCLSDTAISPCSCGGISSLMNRSLPWPDDDDEEEEDVDIPQFIVIDCSRQNLNDSQMSDILDAVLNYYSISAFPPNTAFFTFLAKKNQLTNVPDRIAKLAQLFGVVAADLSYNQITSILSDAFNYPNKANVSIGLNIDLEGNQITAIHTGTFHFPYTSANTTVMISLDDNQITTISSDAFNFPVESCRSN